MAVINDSSGGAGSPEVAEAESDRLGGRVPWAADVGFSNTSRFFPGPTIGTPAYVVIDLSTMEIADTQEGFGGTRALYGAYLR